MVNAKAEDFGRTKPNKKYPEGRLSFVEKFTLVSVEYKRKGLVFTPAYAHLSLDQNATVAGKKKPSRIAENHKSSKVKVEVDEPATEQEKTSEVETVVMATGEELVAVKDENFVLGDVEIDNQGNVGYVETPDQTETVEVVEHPLPAEPMLRHLSLRLRK
jgi:hypothetical protein